MSLEVKIDYLCFESRPSVTFLWKYDGGDNNDPQSGYEIEITDENTGIVIPLTGKDCFGGGKCERSYNLLNFNTDYSWRIRVRDSGGPAGAGNELWSDWAFSDDYNASFTTDPAPPYPDFTWDKDSADSGEEIIFTNVTPNIVGGAPPQRGCFDPAGCTYTWIFDGGDPDSAGPEGPWQQHTITFTEPIEFNEVSTEEGNAKRINLTATDSLGRSCTVTAGTTPGASRKRIKWREISPFEIPSR